MPHTNLSHQQEAVLEQALLNLGYQHKSEFTELEVSRLKQELSTIVLSHGEIEDFIGIGATRTNDEMEVCSQVEGDDKYPIMARNLSRHLIRGVPLCANDGNAIQSSPLFQDEIIASLLTKRDPKLFNAWRVELKIALQNIYNRLSSKTLTEDQEKSYATFLNIVLATYPFIDPEDDEKIHFPVKTQDGWVQREYSIKKLDMSPQTGLLSYLLREEDRMYALGLTPTDPQSGADPIIVFMGTTYPAGQGYDLANLYNFYPFASVGEMHDFTHVENWLADKNNVRVTGHSKGATDAMFAAAKYANHIKQADCFNPAPFANGTMKALRPDWMRRLLTGKAPAMNVYTQPGDPVNHIEDGFLPGTKFTSFIPKSDKCTGNFAPGSLPWYMPSSLIANLIYPAFEGHVHYYPGRKNTWAIDVKHESIKKLRIREVFSDLKSVLGSVFFFVQYTLLVTKLLARETGRDFNEKRGIDRIVSYWGDVSLLTVASIATLISIAAFVVTATAGTILTLAYSGLKIAAKAIFGDSREYIAPEKSSYSLITAKMAECETPSRQAENPFDVVISQSDETFEPKTPKEQVIQSLTASSFFAPENASVEAPVKPEAAPRIKHDSDQGGMIEIGFGNH